MPAALADLFVNNFFLMSCRFSKRFEKGFKIMSAYRYSGH